MGDQSAKDSHADAQQHITDQATDDQYEYRLLVDHATDMLCRLSLDGVFLFVSPATQRVLGFTPEELVGRPKNELVHPEDLHLAQVSSDSGLQLKEYRIRRKDGRYIGAPTSSLVMHDNQGQPREVIASVRDITDRKQTQDNLRHSERLASLGTLAAGIAHEINNPLGAILMAAHAAREFNRKPGQQELVKQMLEQIMSDTRRGAQIVRSVLQFARQEPSDKKAFRLRDLVLNARTLALRQAGNHPIDIKVRGPDDSPWVLVGVMEIEQTVVNLLHNAINAQATRIEVQVRPSAQTQRVIVQIIDNGKGMTSEQVAKAFDPFYTGRSHANGTGLGLSIAQGIIVAHGGKIAISSAPGRGTTVTFDLPLTHPPGTESTPILEGLQPMENGDD